MRRIAIVPTLCTLGNAVCGFAAILYAANVGVASRMAEDQAMYISGWLIFAAMVFDLFDGYLARRTRSASKFGAELDSLCDVVSFGAAPAFLLIRLGAGFEGRLVQNVFLGVAFLYLVCVVLRLARFNVHTTVDVRSHLTFCGLPCPAAAGCIASLVVLRYNFTDPRSLPDAIVNPAVHWLAPICALVVALLMISRVPYVHLANRMLRRRQHFGRLVQLILAVFVLLLLREFGLVVMFWGYALLSPVRFVWNRAWHRTTVEPASEL